MRNATILTRRSGLLGRSGLTSLALGVALALGGTALVPLSGTGSEAMAASYKPTAGADHLNAIIQDLKPVKRPGTSKRVKRVTVPVHPPQYLGGKYQPGVAVDRGYTLNYDHSVDLDVFFPFDSAAITPRAAEALDVLGRALTSPELGNAVYLIAGHTDAKGSDGYNQFLSERRANAARDYLLRNYPIRAGRLVPVGFGESELADPGNPRGGVNRRVEVTLVEDGYGVAPVGQVGYNQGGYDAPAGYDAPVGYEAGSAGNVVCDTGGNRIADPRPARNGLDDFGGRRTPAECVDPAGQAARAVPAGAPAGAVDPAAADPSRSAAAPVAPVPVDELTEGGLNGAIGN